MTTSLRHQHESERNSLNQSFGFEIFHDEAEGYYTARFHIRTYDGIKVDSSWASEEVRLDAYDMQAVHRETVEKWLAWIKALGAQA